MFIILLFLAIQNVFAFIDLPDGVCSFNANRYTGGWYELATSAHVADTMEKDCNCPVAYYTTNTTNSNVIDLTNSCIRNGSFYSVHGNLYPAQKGTPGGNLEVVLAGNGTATGNVNYIVLKQYFTNLESMAPQYAIVGGNDENTWWWISRSPNWNDAVWNNVYYVLLANGYNVTDLHVPIQTCIFTGGHGENLLPNPRGGRKRI